MEAHQLLGSVDLKRGSVALACSLPAAPDEVWRALTEPSRLARWLGRVADGSPAQDGQFAIWHDEAVSSAHTVTRWEPGRGLAMTWDFPDENTSQVSFGLSPRGDGSLVSVQHEGLGEPVNYAAGWHRHLDYLAAHLAGEDKSFETFWDGYDSLVERYAAIAT